MKAYRISKHKYLEDLSGRGAEIHGGRWNKVGTPLLYCCTNLSLAALEQLARNSLVLLNKHFGFVELELPNSIEIKELNHTELPKNWRQDDPSEKTQSIGTKFIREQKSLVLKVPSAMLPFEYNLLINPLHKEFKSIKISNKGSLDLNVRMADSF